MASYASTTELKGRLGISGSSEDTHLAIILNAATALIDGLCNTTFTSTTVTSEEYDGTGSRYLQLRHRPVISVTSVYIDGSLLGSSEYELQAREGFLVVPENEGYVNPRLYSQGEMPDGWVWPRGTNIVSVTYAYGYSATPDAVKLACIYLSMQMYRKEGALGVKSEGMGPRSITYTDTGAITPEVAALLAPYVEPEVRG
jgi:hypothetical protein